MIRNIQKDQNKTLYVNRVNTVQSLLGIVVFHYQQTGRHSGYFYIITRKIVMEKSFKVTLLSSWCCTLNGKISQRFNARLGDEPAVSLSLHYPPP